MLEPWKELDVYVYKNALVVALDSGGTWDMKGTHQILCKVLEPWKELMYIDIYACYK